MKKASDYFCSQKGLTLIEILASIVILSILITSFLSMFVQAAKTNNFSQNKMDATYTAESTMELMSNLVSSATALNSLSTPSGYTILECSTCYGKNVTGHYVYIKVYEKLSGSGLASVIVKVYQDSSKNKQEAQMEDLIAWKK